jgi:hypothetical protein
MNLEKLKNKYNPLKSKDENDIEQNFTPADYDDHRDEAGRPLQFDEQGNRIAQPIQSWKDSAPVVRLSEYMKAHKDHGIKLYQANGEPMLRFEPGLGCADMKTKRWQIAKNIMALIIDAADDIKYLIAHNLIDIQTKPEDASPTIDAAGPSQASNYQGSGHLDQSLHLK